jgi:hypothetical protein
VESVCSKEPADRRASRPAYLHCPGLSARGELRRRPLQSGG